MTSPATSPKTSEVSTAGPLLQLENISKTYPGVKALDDVSLSLERGGVHALLGENGAGKSTLIKVIAGVERADSGTYLLDGRPAEIRNPRQAMQKGISVVHQERNLVPTFTVGENVLLEQVLGRADRLVDRRRVNAEAVPFMEMVGLDVSPASGVGHLSAAQQQLIEIARALTAKASILLLDEPTASISLQEATALLETIRRLRDRGVSIVYVSHKLEEVFEVCDSVNVLRDGRNAGPRLSVDGLGRTELIELMIGRSHIVEALPPRDLQGREPILEVVDRPTEATVRGSSFTLHRGEILGWYGLVGSGRTELARSIIGADVVTGGSIAVRGKPAHIRSMADALHRWRIGYVSENRQQEGLFLLHSIARNIAAPVWERLRRGFRLLWPADEQRLAQEYRASLDIRTPSVATAVASLSGGNKQKVSLAKWLAAKPEILFIDEPTIGIDIRTKYEIHQIIYRLGEEGTSVVLISSDMPEMIRLADRILVFRSGSIVGELANTKDYDEISREIMTMIVATDGPVATEGEAPGQSDADGGSVPRAR
jgi:ribose transport system ATP-binding protein